MRKNVRRVITSVLNREGCNGDSKRTVSTDGTIVWSYKTPIAFFNGRKLGLVTTLAKDVYMSATTKSQIRALEYEFEDEAKTLGVPFVRYDSSSDLMHFAAKAKTKKKSAMQKEWDEPVVVQGVNIEPKPSAQRKTGRWKGAVK